MSFSWVMKVSYSDELIFAYEGYNNLLVKFLEKEYYVTNLANGNEFVRLVRYKYDNVIIG